MTRLLNYLLLFITILIFAGLVIPFAILQVQVNSGEENIKNIINNNFQFGPVKNALIAGIFVPVVAIILSALQQYFYIKNLKTKMEYPVAKNLVNQYQWVGISLGGLIGLEILFFVCGFCVGDEWVIRKWLFIGGMIVTSIYGIIIYIWATIINMRIMYDQAKQQALVDEQNNDKNPPHVPNESPVIEETIVFDNDNQSTIENSNSNLDNNNIPSSGNF